MGECTHTPVQEEGSGGDGFHLRARVDFLVGETVLDVVPTTTGAFGGAFALEAFALEAFALGLEAA